MLSRGGTTKQISDDESIRELIIEMMESGVTFNACKACADNYNISDKFIELVVDIK